MKKTKPFKKAPPVCKVIHQGAMVINHGYIYEHSENICAIAIDMKSKRGEVIGDGMDNGIPSVIIGANEESLKLHKTKPKDSMTEIEFPNHKGFTVWSAQISKYTIRVCLVKLNK